jgi:8-oxo-dGTP pyrophosphatase MutT (NUDIX family)/phosphohistidine phosphatase SixA
MADRQAAGEILAAGAVLWRPAGRGTQVALIHRPKYDDWSFPKGKLESGEHALLAAVREVAEETGMQVTLGLRLPAVSYVVDDQPKVVDYWAARADSADARFVANSEVDRLDWVALSRAAIRLSYEHDVRLLADFTAALRPTVPVILVRHAAAGSKSDWRHHDALRPLDARGKQQAKVLARLLRCFGTARVLSSPAERCVATVRPYASSVGATVEVVPALGLPEKKSSRPVAEEQALAAATVASEAAAADQPVVICAHRENLPLLLAAACDRLGAAVPAGRGLRKGGFWVLHGAGGQLAGTERHHPEQSRLPAARCRMVQAAPRFGWPLGSAGPGVRPAGWLAPSPASAAARPPESAATVSPRARRRRCTRRGHRWPAPDGRAR